MVLLEERTTVPTTRTRITPKRVAADDYTPEQRANLIAQIQADTFLMGELLDWIVELLRSDDATKQIKGLYFVYKFEDRLAHQARIAREEQARQELIFARAKAIAEGGLRPSVAERLAQQVLANADYVRVLGCIEGGRHAYILSLLKSPKDTKVASGVSQWAEIQWKVEQVLDFERMFTIELDDILSRAQYRRRIWDLQRSAADLMAWLDFYKEERGEEGRATFEKHMVALDEGRNNPAQLARAVEKADLALGAYIARCYWCRNPRCKPRNQK